MKTVPFVLAPVSWIVKLFSARSASEGKIADVERLVGREIFSFEVRRRSFRPGETVGQFIVLSNRQPVRRLDGTGQAHPLEEICKILRRFLQCPIRFGIIGQ